MPCVFFYCVPPSCSSLRCLRRLGLAVRCLKNLLCSASLACTHPQGSPISGMRLVLVVVDVLGARPCVMCVVRREARFKARAPSTRKGPGFPHASAWIASGVRSWAVLLGPALRWPRSELTSRGLPAARAEVDGQSQPSFFRRAKREAWVHLIRLGLPFTVVMIFSAGFPLALPSLLPPDVRFVRIPFLARLFVFVQTRHHEWIYGPNYGLVDFSLSRDGEARPKVARECPTPPHPSDVLVGLWIPAFSPNLQACRRRRLGTCC